MKNYRRGVARRCNKYEEETTTVKNAKGEPSLKTSDLEHRSQ